MQFSIWKRKEQKPDLTEGESGGRMKKKGRIRENIEVILSAILIAVLIRVFLVDNYEIPSGSMIPTMLEGDRLFVSKFNYGVRLPILPNWKLPRFDSPDHGDIVIFQYPNYRSPGWLSELADLFTFSIFGLDPMPKNYVKRVMGLPGDHVRIDPDGTVWRNGKPVGRRFFEERALVRLPADGAMNKHIVRYLSGTNLVYENTVAGSIPSWYDPRNPEMYRIYREGDAGSEYLVQYLTDGFLQEERKETIRTMLRPFPLGPKDFEANIHARSMYTNDIKNFYKKIANIWLEQNMLQSSYYMDVLDRETYRPKKILLGPDDRMATVDLYSMEQYAQITAKTSDLDCLVYASSGEAWYRVKGMTNLQPLFAIYSNRLCVVVPKEHYFVMGDNRDNSSDSRDWGFLHKDYLMGSPLIRYLPFSRFGTMD